MKLVTRLVLMCCSLLVVTAALASARPAPEVSPLPNAGEPITRVRVGPQSVSSVCDLGVSTGAAWLINYILPPNDAYYTLLDPAACGLPSLPGRIGQTSPPGAAAPQGAGAATQRPLPPLRVRRRPRGQPPSPKSR